MILSPPSPTRIKKVGSWHFANWQLPTANFFNSISEKVFAGKRITPEEGFVLFESRNLSALGMLANHVREKKNGNATYYNRNFHIEPTNVCVFSCNFCS